MLVVIQLYENICLSKFKDFTNSLPFHRFLSNHMQEESQDLVAVRMHLSHLCIFGQSQVFQTGCCFSVFHSESKLVGTRMLCYPIKMKEF